MELSKDPIEVGSLVILEEPQGVNLDGNVPWLQRVAVNSFSRRIPRTTRVPII